MKTKIRHWMRDFFILTLILLSNMIIITKSCQAGEKYDLVAFMNECQKMSVDPGIIAIVQWIPEEWWQLTLERAEVPESRIKEVLELFEPYTSFIVIHGKITSSGLPSFSSEEIIRRHLFLKDEPGQFYTPIDDENISAGVRNAIIMIKPIFSNMLGRMGENMNFFFFTNKNTKGGKICQAKKEGAFCVYLKDIPDVKDQVFEWILPLNSLVPFKICPKCIREAKGSWRYCPWCGAFLGSRERRIKNERQVKNRGL